MKKCNFCGYKCLDGKPKHIPSSEAYCLKCNKYQVYYCEVNNDG